MKITSSESKNNLVRSVKGFINFMDFKVKVRPHKYKKVRYAIKNISVRRTFQILLGSLKNYLMKVLIRRGPNMSLMTATFTYNDSLRSV